MIWHAIATSCYSIKLVESLVLENILNLNIVLVWTIWAGYGMFPPVPSLAVMSFEDIWWYLSLNEVSPSFDPFHQEPPPVVHDLSNCRALLNINFVRISFSRAVSVSPGHPGDFPCHTVVNPGTLGKMLWNPVGAHSTGVRSKKVKFVKPWVPVKKCLI